MINAKQNNRIIYRFLKIYIYPDFETDVGEVTEIFQVKPFTVL